MKSVNLFKRHTDHTPFLVSGPCSAETPEQLYQIASDLISNVKLDVLRAGIWKPRTRPNSFEGNGEDALKWLLNTKNELGLKTTVEVANAKHVELALKYEVDILWIGARTTVNPFSVQEIADAIKGIDIPVMIKNPINPDLQLWIGAIERIQQAGVKQLAAIHRGFSAYGPSTYRNKPVWEIPIELKRKFSDLPIICDPSHIGGKRELIKPIAQKAMDLTFDGLMIESHFDPDNAWSDAQQQITPLVLADLLNNLALRSTNLFNDEVLLKFQELRLNIDALDETILRKIGERMQLIENLGEIKKEKHIPILQVERWNSIIKAYEEIGTNSKLSKKFITEFLNAIHTESIRRQTNVMN